MVAAKRKAVRVILIALAALFAVCIYAKFDPETTPFPKCPFFWATGLKCPGCGSQRALHQLLHLRVGAAFGYNACLVLFIPVLLFLFSADASILLPAMRRLSSGQPQRAAKPPAPLIQKVQMNRQ